MLGYAWAHVEASLITFRISMENRGGSTFYPKPKSTRQDSWEALQTFLKAEKRGKKTAIDPSLPNLKGVESEEGESEKSGCVVVE